ncbi:hypothetical protein [Serratia sp. Se-RSBMAAmG]|uniref:hypothetical protein n=1 Tax=Serratia sp. Se-RSBMAAmG TaxID=3043305 RepID=UPI0024AF12A1|nr:hypothetical protein [Serratia sp. Se-RSBMAAmG]MDI6976613.1 hypothetical protein [Serratia sp. Se-RSBMAAmG]
MTQPNFYASFPKDPEELYDFPPKVTWKDEEPGDSDEKISIKLQVSITEDSTWDVKMATKKEKLLSFSLTHEEIDSDKNDGETIKKWTIKDLSGSKAEEFDSNNVSEVLQYCAEESSMLFGYAIDEIKSRNRMRPR